MDDNAAHEVAMDVDTASIDDSTDEMEMSTAKIDNLERFPVEILEKIFIRTNDIALLQLAETCTKFAAIAQNVFSKRYSNQYFIVNGYKNGGDPEYYVAIFNHFGTDINAIQFNGHDSDADDYVVKMLLPHANHIKKLTFNCDSFSADFLSPFDNITHLIFRNCYPTGDLPEFGKLFKLEALGPEISKGSFERIIRNNPMIQSLLLHYNFGIGYMKLAAILQLIAENLHQIKELTLVNDDMDADMLEDELERSINALKSLKHLESLTLSVNHETLPLLPHLGPMDKQIKYLGLHLLYDYEPEHRYRLDETWNEIKLQTNYQLPNFRHLSIEYAFERDCSAILSLLSKYPSLEKITIIFEGCMHPEKFFSVQLFDEFMETVTMADKPNARIEFERECGEIIGSFSVNGIVWGKKLMYWNGCDENSSNVHLLNLADQLEEFKGLKITKGAKRDADQLNLLDRIFDYLDIRSLHSFAETSQQSKQLVKSYAKKHLDRNGTFTFTNEIHSFDDIHFVSNFDDFDFLMNFAKNFGNIGKLSIYNHYDCEYPYSRPISLVSHVVYDSSQLLECSDLCEISGEFPNAETIEFKNAGIFGDLDKASRFHFIIAHEDYNLKKFIFNYRGETQMKNLKDIFKSTNTQLIPIFKKNSNSNYFEKIEK